VEEGYLQKRAALKAAVPPKKVVVNLDLEPSKRWAFLADDPHFANFKEEFYGYLKDYVPKFLIEPIASILKNLRGSFYDDYAQEMEGLAKALDVSLGDIVVVNLIYQIEGIGVKCSKRNTTGPCPPTEPGPAGLCTGILADDGNKVFQGRNMDWNLPPALLKFVIEADYQSQNRTKFVGVSVAGQVGVLHGLAPGGFSIEMNSRNTGGNVLANLADLILGAKTPGAVIRRALETETNFDDGVKFLSSERLANPVYFIVGGAEHGEGTILSRERKGLLDAWNLYEAPSKDTKKVNIQPDWFRVQTNYDHWDPIPSYDNRRDPGVAHVKQFCNDGAGVDQNCVWKAMTTWPTMNHHTDITSIMCAKTGYMNTTVWMNPSVLV
jgi:N-acylethanolamine-hydrolysing acid amidase